MVQYIVKTTSRWGRAASVKRGTQTVRPPLLPVRAMVDIPQARGLCRARYREARCIP